MEVLMPTTKAARQDIMPAHPTRALLYLRQTYLRRMAHNHILISGVVYRLHPHSLNPKITHLLPNHPGPEGDRIHKRVLRHQMPPRTPTTMPTITRINELEIQLLQVP